MQAQQKFLHKIVSTLIFLKLKVPHLLFQVYSFLSTPSVALLFTSIFLFSFQGAMKILNVPSKLNNARMERSDLGCYTEFFIL